MEMQQTQYEDALRPADGPFKKNPLGPGAGEPQNGIATPIVSPAVDVENSDRSEPILLQKTNHVSTVLLYGIPIVSLYIEGQERLCLAQISNTLLKQFSYNEIHNRRVALGITCVQCTPVQLEILRRAGAMPISSRRCGMITRREAERLCKSFLGDNSPPRLPDDFAFSVFHKCAWGCRGSFLPARYNSSRAKCIKCSYCGMFFSPNKFIFHSHRVNVSDKYVQPDAANFNSWRRHMMLSGQPPEQITHAWEDVKAMFNGGTRKRVVSRRASPASPKAGASPPLPQQCKSSVAAQLGLAAEPGKLEAASSRGAGYPTLPSPKRPREPQSAEKNNNELPPKKAAGEGCGVPALRQSGDPVPAAGSAPQQSPASAVHVRHASPDDMHLMPFSCSLMMDYMWQQHQKQSLQQQYQHQQPLNPAKLKPFNGETGTPASAAYENSLSKSASFAQFQQCPYPWLKSSGPFSSAAALAAATAVTQTTMASPTPPVAGHHLHHPWLADGSRKALASSNAAIDDLFNGGLYKRPAPLYQRPCVENPSLPMRGVPLHQVNASAFKPVLHHSVSKGVAEGVAANSATYSAISMTIATQNIPKIGPTAPPGLLPLLSTHLILPRDASATSVLVAENVKDSHSSSEEEDAHKNPTEYGDDEDEDDELVDIETTEEETLAPSYERSAAKELSAAWLPAAIEGEAQRPFPDSEPIAVGENAEKSTYPAVAVAPECLGAPSLSSVTSISQESVDTCEKNNNMYVHLHTFDMSSNSSNACSYTRTQSKSESNNTDSSVEIIDELPTDNAADIHTVSAASCAARGVDGSPPDDASDAFNCSRLRHKHTADSGRSGPRRCVAKKTPPMPQPPHRQSNVSGSEFWTIASRLYLQHPFNCEVTTNLVSVQHSSSHKSLQQYLLQQYQDHQHHQQYQHQHQSSPQQDSQREHFYCIPMADRDPCKRHPTISADGLPAKKARWCGAPPAPPTAANDL